MSNAKELREARRRKILERGGDRLAYITGQVKVLPPVEPNGAVASPPGESGLKSLSIAGELPSSSEGLSSLISSAYNVNNISKKLSGVRDELQYLDSAPEETTPLLPPSPTPSPPLSTSQQQDDTAPPVTSRTASSPQTRTSFNYANLVKAIEQSSLIRAILAFVIGLALVIQWTCSKCQHASAFGSQNYILSWPIFLVMITDVSVVLGALLLDSAKVSPAAANTMKLDRGGLAVFRDARMDHMLALTSQLEGALDLGLLVTKASNGLISDISLYLVTVICAVSITQHYQPAFCTYMSR